MGLPVELRWEMFFCDLLWIGAIVVGAICVAVALHAKRVWPAVTTIMLCFVMAVALIGLGVFGTWRGGLAIYEIIGVAGDISVEAADGRWSAFEVKLGTGKVDGAADNLLKLAERVDTKKCGLPQALGVIVGTGLAYKRPDGVAVIPIGALGP